MEQILSNKKNRLIPALSGLRTVAAALVFFYHWFFSYADNWPLLLRAPFVAGYIGVPIFFALSGFLITVRYTRPFTQGELSYKVYLWRRFIRIFPLYLFILLLFVLAFGKPDSMMPNTTLGYFSVFSLTQAFFPNLLLIGTAVGWTLTLELIFYLIAPPLLSWLNKTTHYTSLILRACATAAAFVAAGYLIPQLPEQLLAARFPQTLFNSDALYLMHYTIFGHMPDFIAGVVCGFVYLRHDPRQFTTRFIHTLIAGSLLCSYLATLPLASFAAELGSPLNRFFSFLPALGTAILVTALAWDQQRPSRITRLLSWSPLVYLGAISYALYLIQLTEPIQRLYWLFLGEQLGVENRILRAVLLYLLTTLVAIPLYHLIEKPTHRFLKRTVKRSKTTTNL